MTKTHLSFAGLIAFTIASCGGATAETNEATDDTTVATGGGTDEGGIPSPPTPWADMSFDERKSWMALEVTPRFEPLFAEHDGERFAGFSCEGCHGETGQERNYEMPNPDIMTLYATGSQEQIDMVNDMRPMVNFMFRTVVPTMKQLIGAPDYDEATGEGFSCYYCHPNGGEGTPATETAEASE